MQKFKPSNYPLVLKVTDGHLWVSSPDFMINLTERADHFRKPEQIGEMILSAWQRIEELLKKRAPEKEPPIPSKNKDLFPEPAERLVSISQVARALGLSEQTIRRMAARGEIGAKKTPGGHLRFKESEVSLQARERQMPTARPAAS